MKLVGNAHLVSGSFSRTDAVLALLKSEGFEIESNPDVFVRSYPYFGIDDARQLCERADMKAMGERRIFIVAATVMSTDSQNKLLKTFEEPPGDALFFLIVPSPETLLPTLRSRMQVLEVVSGHDEGIVDSAEFLRAPVEKRLTLLKPLLDKDADDKRDISAVIIFLSSVERMLSKMEHNAGKVDGLGAVYRARRYLNDKGSLIKPLLEQVALLVPLMKT